MPKTISETLDTLAVKYGMVLPLGDLIASNAYETLSGQVQTGQYIIGRSIVSHDRLHVTCHHLAFSQESVDWEIWIEAGKNPVPRRMVITYKQVDGNPKYRLKLNDWQFDGIDNGIFTLLIPPNAIEVQASPAD